MLRTGDILGYARVSTVDQVRSGQKNRLKQNRAVRVFGDVISKNRPTGPVWLPCSTTPAQTIRLPSSGSIVWDCRSKNCLIRLMTSMREMSTALTPQMNRMSRSQSKIPLFIRMVHLLGAPHVSDMILVWNLGYNSVSRPMALRLSVRIRARCSGRSYVATTRPLRTNSGLLASKSRSSVNPCSCANWVINVMVVRVLPSRNG